MPGDLLRSPLASEHERLGAKLVGFGGWEMPLSYPAGTIAEHLACREDAVAFDVSHLGTVVVEGPSALETLQNALSNDLSRIEPGRAQYTHLLDDADGSVLDDLIVWWVAEETFHVMPNASNTERVVSAIGGRDTTSDRAVVAIQGPQAREKLGKIAPDAAEVGRFRVGSFEWQNRTGAVAGTGYTGEDGVECAVPVEVAASFWRALIDAGVAPAGLGARDTLRLEAGLPLHGHELGPGITPLQAGLGWVVGWSKPTFRGKAALEREREVGIGRALRGLTIEGRQPAREGCVVRRGDQVIGTVTSGNFSPVLGHGIAMAFLTPEVPIGAEVTIDVRGRSLDASVASLPFVTPKKS